MKKNTPLIKMPNIAAAYHVNDITVRTFKKRLESVTGIKISIPQLKKIHEASNVESLPKKCQKIVNKLDSWIIGEAGEKVVSWVDQQSRTAFYLVVLHLIGFIPKQLEVKVTKKMMKECKRTASISWGDITAAIEYFKTGDNPIASTTVEAINIDNRYFEILIENKISEIAKVKFEPSDSEESRNVKAAKLLITKPYTAAQLKALKNRLIKSGLFIGQPEGDLTEADKAPSEVFLKWVGEQNEGEDHYVAIDRSGTITYVD